METEREKRLFVAVFIAVLAVGLGILSLFYGVLDFWLAHQCLPWSRAGWILLTRDIPTEGCRY